MHRWSWVVLGTTLAFGCGDDAADGAARDGASETVEDATDVAVDTNDVAADTSDGAVDTKDSGADTNDVAADSGADTSDSGADTNDVAADTGDAPLGGERPAKVTLPLGYSPDTPRPLAILLHGYSVTGAVQDAYLHFTEQATAAGFIAVVPEGTRDATGNPFWNASPGWCCDFGKTGVDDEGYLLGLVAEARARFAVDPARIYLFGHSNGGFMSHKLACEHPDVFAAIAVLAGSLPDDANDCNPGEPISVLQIHGTADAVIYYNGVASQYPGAAEIMERWAGHEGCELLPTSEAEHDYDTAVLGAETLPHRYPSCTSGTAVELWELRGSGHIPLFDDTFTPAVLEWLAAHPKH